MYSRSSPRRRHGAELKAAVLAACNEPGASVAAVAQAHGLNANLVHKWRRGRGVPASLAPAAQTAAPVVPTHIPVQLPAPATPPERPEAIHIELRRGALAVNVHWPTHAAVQCAAWLREILR